MSMLAPPAATRMLGRSDVEVSTLAWGMWRFAGGLADATRLVHAVLDAGISFFDTADIYGFDGTGGFGDAEALLGQVLAADPAIRDRIVLTTKGGIMPPLPYDSSAAYLASAIDASLRRLQVESVELWQIHRPDILTHPEEIARAIGDAMAAGKIGTVGVSNMTVSQIGTLQQFLDCPIITTQPEISPLRIDCFENGELDQAMAMDMAVLAWSPLGGGRIAAPETPRETAVVAELDRVAAAAGVSRTAAAYSWLMAHPAGIIPIVGTQNVDRIAEATDAYKLSWSRQDWYAVLVAARGAPLP
jgi:predicted oxidoreductase